MAIAQDATIKVGGRLMLDYTIADFEDADFTVNNSRVRRARLFARGKYGDSINYKVEFNKSTGSNFELTDAYIQFAPKSSKFKIKVGQFKTHNSMEEETSSRFTTTLERGAYTDAFGLNRRIGVSVNTSGDNYGFDLGVFGTNVEEQSGTIWGRLGVIGSKAIRRMIFVIANAHIQMSPLAALSIRVGLQRAIIFMRAKRFSSKTAVNLIALKWTIQLAKVGWALWRLLHVMTH